MSFYCKTSLENKSPYNLSKRLDNISETSLGAGESIILTISDQVHACEVAGSSHTMCVHLHCCVLGVTQAHGFIAWQIHTDTCGLLVHNHMTLCKCSHRPWPVLLLLCVSVRVREISWCFQGVKNVSAHSVTVCAVKTVCARIHIYIAL